MAIVLSETTNDITVNGVSVATDTEVSTALAGKANTADVNTQLSLKANTAEVSSAVERAVPAGTIINFAAATAPTGYLKANGALVSRTAYSTLFAAIGTTFGAGDGSTTFALPDLRGYFPRGWDDGRGIDTSRAFGSTQEDELKSHSHTISVGISMAAYSAQNQCMIGGGSTTTSLTGGTETRPKNIALLYCIKY